jgi:integrase
VHWRALPPLIRGYLRVGAQVDNGAVIDHDFGTTDVFMILDTSETWQHYRSRFVGSNCPAVDRSLVDEWVTAIGLRREDYGTHSLRRTKAALIYKQTGNLRAVQILLGHTKIETTVRYLGVEVEDALALAEATEI